MKSRPRTKLVLRGDRMVISKALRMGMVEDLHAAHQRIALSLRRAQESINWPNTNHEVKDVRCEICLAYIPHQQKEPLQSHKVSDCPCSKIAADLFKFENKDCLQQTRRGAFHQGEDKPEPDNEDAGILPTHDNGEY